MQRHIPAAIVTTLLLSGCAVTTTKQPSPGPGSPAAPAQPASPARSAPAHSAESLITEASIRSHMTFLASDALNGRGSGTRDEWIAAEYIGAQLQRIGLEPLGDDGGFVQRIEVERTETTAPPVMTAGNAKYTHGSEILVQSLSAARVSGPLQLLGPDARPHPGAVVLMPEAVPANYQQEAAAAVAVLLLETPQVRARWGAGRRLPAPPARIVGLPAGAGARPATVYLDKASYAAVAALRQGTSISIEADVKTATRSHTWNAVGRLPGSDPGGGSEVILLSAHLDHVGSRPGRETPADADTIYNGADDDASGTIAVMELAQALAQGPRPKRTIVFAFFGSEEAGGFGSRYFADRPVVPLSEVVANLQFEMIGRPDNKVPAQTLWLTGYERSNLGPELAKQGAQLVQDPHPEQSFFTRSDNIQFARRGVVAHTVSSYGLHQEYHQPSDEARHINYAHMTTAIRSMLGPIRWLADSTFKPAWNPGMKP